jgi:geranylgeranyl pyrophosphate synthase
VTAEVGEPEPVHYPHFSLDAFLEDERRLAEAALERALSWILPLVPESCRGPAAHVVRAGGKRLRPILCHAAFVACGGLEAHPGRESAVTDLGAAVELVHAYSLMHDDLPCMDDAGLRRGLPTPHILFGEASATWAGVVLIPAAALWVWEVAGRAGLQVEGRREALRILARAAGMDGMVGGQALDLLAERRTLDREALDGLHGMKTGALLTAPLLLGALAADAGVKRREALERYGRAIGLAFQITDDILDATADVSTLGKVPSDHEMGKSTYVSLLGVEEARERASACVGEALNALSAANLEALPLEALARYVVARDR